jgi:hypothetical protein
MTMTDDETYRRAVEQFQRERMANIDEAMKARQTMGPLGRVRHRAESAIANEGRFTPPLTEKEKAELDRIASAPQENDQDFLDSLTNRLPEFEDIGRTECRHCKTVTLHIFSEASGIICSVCRG